MPNTGKRLPKKRPPSKRSATKFVQGGFVFRLIRREGDVAMLVKTKPGMSYESIEVVVLEPAVTKIVKGAVVQFEESLPRSEAWGKRSWTYPDQDDADRKFFEIVKREERRKRKQIDKILTL